MRILQERIRMEPVLHVVRISQDEEVKIAVIMAASIAPFLENKESDRTLLLINGM